MQVERTNNEIRIRFSEGTDLIGLQRILDYIKFREIASKSKANQKEIDELASDSKASWWVKNKTRFVKFIALSKNWMHLFEQEIKTDKKLEERGVDWILNTEVISEIRNDQ